MALPRVSILITLASFVFLPLTVGAAPSCPTPGKTKGGFSFPACEAFSRETPELKLGDLTDLDSCPDETTLGRGDVKGLKGASVEIEKDLLLNQQRSTFLARFQKSSDIGERYRHCLQQRLAAKPLNGCEQALAELDRFLKVQLPLLRQDLGLKAAMKNVSRVSDREIKHLHGGVPIPALSTEEQARAKRRLESERKKLSDNEAVATLAEKEYATIIEQAPFLAFIDLRDGSESGADQRALAGIEKWLSGIDSQKDRVRRMKRSERIDLIEIDGLMNETLQVRAAKGALDLSTCEAAERLKEEHARERLTSELAKGTAAGVGIGAICILSAGVGCGLVAAGGGAITGLSSAYGAHQDVQLATSRYESGVICQSDLDKKIQARNLAVAVGLPLSTVPIGLVGSAFKSVVAKAAGEKAVSQAVGSVARSVVKAEVAESAQLAVSVMANKTAAESALTKALAASDAEFPVAIAQARGEIDQLVAKMDSAELYAVIKTDVDQVLAKGSYYPGHDSALSPPFHAWIEELEKVGLGKGGAQSAVAGSDSKLLRNGALTEIQAANTIGSEMMSFLPPSSIKAMAAETNHVYMGRVFQEFIERVDAGKFNWSAIKGADGKALQLDVDAIRRGLRIHLDDGLPKAW